MEKYFDVLFLDGELANVGSVVLCAVCFTLKWSTRSPWPLTCQALKGWRKASPAVSRDAAPWEAVLLMASTLARRSREGALAAIASLLAFDCYLRPSETLNLRCDAVFPPKRARGPYSISLCCARLCKHISCSKLYRIASEHRHVMIIWRRK